MIRLARHALKHPRAWILGVVVSTLAVGSGVTRLELHTEGSVIRPPGQAAVRQTEIDRLRFHDPRQVILLVGARNDGPQVASPEGFRYLRQLQFELRRLSAVRADGIVSLAGMPRLVEGQAGISVGTYLDDIPDDPEGFDALLATLRERQPTDGLLLSPDGRFAAFYVPLVENTPVSAAIEELDGLVQAGESGPFSLRLTGPQIAEATLGHMVLRDLAVLIPVMVALIAVLLYGTLRTPGGVLIPLAEVAVVLAWVLGGMGWAGVPVTLVTTILPVVLMAMAITDEIHLLERVQAAPADEPLGRRVAGAVAEVGRPIVVTSVTTALGFLSFLSASVVPLRQFGLFTAAGILLAMVLSFCWIPALIVVLPPAWFRSGRGVGAGSTRQDPRVGWGARHQTAALIVGLLVVALAVPGLGRLRVQDAWIDNFDPAAPLVTAEADFNETFWGSYRFDVVFEAGPEFFYTPRGAELMEAFLRLAGRAPRAGGTMSYLTPLGDVARTLDEHRPLSELPRATVADLATVAEMSASRSTLRQLLTDGGEAARAQLFVNGSNYARAQALQEYLDRGLPALAEQYGVAYHYSGDLPVATAVVDAIVGNQLRSIGWALVAVAAALWLFSRRLEAWIALVPVAAAAVILLGVMGYSGMPLGIATSMFTSLTIGVGVDFGVHFRHRYRRERRDRVSHIAALQATYGNTGRALRWNMTVLALGFCVLTLSSLKPNHDLGVLLAAAMLTCYAATLLFLPRLLSLLATAALVALVLTGTSGAAPSACPAEPDPAAQALMAGLEADFRGEARIVRMEIATAYRPQHPLWRHFKDRPDRKILWGVFDGNAKETRLLYVFSGPGRLAGTTLLMHDVADTKAADASWLFLRSFNTLSALNPRSQKLLVPGTALSYEDSRGFIPADKYTFSFVSAPDDGNDTPPSVLACPKSATIAENLGYSSLQLTIDRARRLVRRVEFHDLGGKPLKRYELIREVRLGRRWVPQEVRLDHRSDGYFTTISYRHWVPREPPPPALFEASVEQASFIGRLQPWLGKMGLAEVIDPEIAAADALVKAYDDARRKEREGQ